MKKNSPIGIDIHPGGVRALQLVTDRRGMKVRAAAHIAGEAPEDKASEERQGLAAMVRTVVRQGAFKGRIAVVGMCHDDVSAFPVTIALSPGESFEAVLARACGQHLSFPLEEAVIDYFGVEELTDRNGTHLRVNVVAAHQLAVAKVLKAMRQSGLKVRVIDYDLCALVRSHNRVRELTPSPSVLLSMDDASTLLAVADKAKIIAHRQLDWGMDRLLERIADALKLDRESRQPLSMLGDYGVDYDALQGGAGQPPEIPNGEQISALRVLSQILVPNMEELVRELFQIIGYTRSLTPEIQFRELCLYGLANGVKNLGPFLEKRLHITARPTDPFEALTFEKADLSDTAGCHEYVRALGLALREAA